MYRKLNNTSNFSYFIISSYCLYQDSKKLFFYSFLCRLTSDAKRIFGGWNLDFVLVSKYKDPEDSSDSDESEEKTESMFVASTHLNLRKQNHIDLYSVSIVSSDKENKDDEDVIVPEEELDVESENVEKVSDEPYKNTDKKNWTFRFPSFGLGGRSTSAQEENVDDDVGKDDQDVPETLPVDTGVPEEGDSEKTKYIVKVKTSDKFTAGTRSEVYIYLYGEIGDSSKSLL